MVKGFGPILPGFKHVDWGDHDGLEAAIDGLREVARQKRGRSLKLQEIDGEPARKSPLASRLLAAGFRVDLQGLILMETPG